MNTTSRVALIALALLAVLAASACGGGGGANGDTRAAETDIQEEDQALADAIVLKLSDLPTGWRTDPEEDDEDEENLSDRCVNLDFSDLVITGRAESDDFTSGSVTSATSVAAVYAEGADEAFEQLASEETATCVRDFLREEADENPPEDAEIGEITVGELSFPSVGENSRVYQVVMEIKAESFTPNVYVDLVFIQKDRAVALVAFIDALTPFDNDLKVELAQLIASRMTAG